MKGVSVCSLPTRVDRILLPQTTNISTTSVASPNTVRISVSANYSSFTVDIDNDLDIESVETEDADNDTPAPREQTSVDVDKIKKQETEPVKLGISKKKIGFYTIKPQALRTPRVLTAFDGDDKEKPPAKEMRKQVLRTPSVMTAFDGDEKEKPSAKEMRKQVLQDALEQPLQEPGSVQGHLRTGLFSLYLKTATVKTTSLEPQVTTDRAKTMQGKTEEITPMSRKTDKFVPSTE